MAKIDHVGITVSSIAEARRLYERLGLSVLKEVEEDEGMRSVTIPLGESSLKLMQSDKPTQEGLHHLALHVDDISGAFEEMKQAGIQLISDEIEIGAGGRLHFMVHPLAANGVLLEICQDPITAV